MWVIFLVNWKLTWVKLHFSEEPQALVVDIVLHQRRKLKTTTLCLLRAGSHFLSAFPELALDLPWPVFSSVEWEYDN